MVLLLDVDLTDGTIECCLGVFSGGTMQKSESIADLAAALSKAQGAFAAAKKDAANPFFKSHYATLAAVLDVIRDPLSQNGLALIQGVNGEEFETILTHASGQWISFSEPFKPVKNDPQSIGSLKSYLRRYSIMSILGIATEDDDAETAMVRIEPKHKPSFTPSTPAQSKSKEDALNFVFPIGVHAGKQVKSLPPEERIKYLTDVISKPSKDGTKHPFQITCEQLLDVLGG